MVAPSLYFFYNSSTNDTAYMGNGEETSDWKLISVSGTIDTKVFTGGGINNGLPVPTASYGSRDATIRPLGGRIPIPQIYIESVGKDMVNVPLAGKNTNRYVFAVYVDGYITCDLYLECWDDNNFLTYDLPVLSGTNAYPDSMVNAYRTTSESPPSNWEGVTLSGAEEVPPANKGVCLKGSVSRLRLKGSDSISNEAVYYNMYVSLPYDAPLFHNQPVEAFRYLYI